MNKCQTIQAASVMHEWATNQDAQIERRLRGSSGPWDLCGENISWNWVGYEHRVAPKPIKVVGWAVVEADTGRIVYQGVVKSYIQEWCADLNKSKCYDYVVVELTGTVPRSRQ